MLIVICGEDSVTSFNYYSSLKKEYISKNYEIKDISVNDFESLSLWMAESQPLFSLRMVFFTKNINKKLSRKLNLKFNKVIKSLTDDKNVEIISWEEELSSRFLKFPKGAIIKEFKPSESIFKLQDALYPGNLKNFLALLHNLAQSADENFIFIMLCRHLRNLLFVKTGRTGNKLQKWQIYKLKSQAAKWNEDKLINFYDSLHKIDVNQKTSNSPYSIKKSLEVLACYYL